MTNMEAVAQVNYLCSNQIEDMYKLQWLDRLDRLVIKELHAAFDGLDIFDHSAELQERELLVKPPYDEMYLYYLEMNIHAITGENVKYNASLDRFNASYKAYGDYLCRTTPAKRVPWRLY